MTREEALNKAINIVRYFEAHFAKSKEAREAAVNIIDALEQEPKLRQALEQEKGAYNALVKDLQCSDCISRQAVLDMMQMRMGAKELYRAVYDLPLVTPAEKVGQWIPVSERLPKDGQSVLFCDIDNDIMVGYHVKGRPVTHFSQDGTYEDMKDVRAWMPLPEPYTEGGEQNE